LQRNDAEISIDAPQELVFEWLTEPELMQRWISGLLEFEPLDPGPASGSRSRQTLRVKGQTFSLDSVITSFEPPGAFDVKVEHRGFESASHYRLEEHEGHTHLAVTIETTYKLFANRLLGALVTRETQKKLDADLERLKELVEADAQDRNQSFTAR
jgi:uncharacterized protein YndB with AHSA1/START domain